MRRRAFLHGAGALSLLPLSARGQAVRVRRVAVLLGYSAADPVAQVRFAAFREGLRALGWVEGRNLKMDVRWSAGDPQRASMLAKELVALGPEVILANTTPVTAAVQRETLTIPIVFTVVSDPVGSRFVMNLSRPGGNITGIINIESSLAQKWVELLKQIAPRIKRAAVVFNPQTAPYAEYYLSPMNVAGTAFGVKIFAAPVRSVAEIEDVIAALGREADAGLIVMTDSFMTVHRNVVIASTARNRIPAIYFAGDMPLEGGLMSYGVDIVELFRRAAPYVDRILRGAKPADLPIEQPSKFEFFINAKTVKALGLNIPSAMLLRADKVIE
jgi:putative ABC transport system substrate-binding protein